MELKHPLRKQAELVFDLKFTIMMKITLKDRMTEWQKSKLKHLSDIVERCEELDSACHVRSHGDILSWPARQGQAPSVSFVT